MNQYNVGSRWWKMDFHTHTPASKDFGRGDSAQKNLSLDDWIKAAMGSGLDAVAVTDHNTGKSVDAFKDTLARISEQKPEWYRPLVIFPGVEISAGGNGERVHVLGIFDPGKTSSEILGILGKCNICAKYGEDETCFTDKGAFEVAKIIQEEGGIPILAHVDGPKGVLHGKTTLPPELKKWLRNICAMEVCQGVAMTTQEDQRIISRIAQVGGSDAHAATDIGKHFTWVKMGKPTLSALRIALHDHSFCVKSEAETNPNHDPDFYVRNVSISNLRCCGRGPSGPLTLNFSPHLSSLIGGRGTGKSTVIECLRHVFKQEPNRDELPMVYERMQKFNEGMIVPESKISAEFAFHGSLFRVQRSEEGNSTVLEEYASSTNSWNVVDSRDIGGRFQIGVYSQKQLFELASDPRGLLSIIDKSDSVNKGEWNRRWDVKKSEYLQLCVRARELRNRVNSLTTLSPRIADLDKKIKEYQNKGYGAILRRMALFNRQAGALQVEDDIKAAANSLRADVDALHLPEFQEDIFPETDEACNEVRKSYLGLANQVVSARKAILSAAEAVMTATTVYRKSIDNGTWAEQKRSCESEYAEKAQQLKAQGDSFDPDLYGRWVAERSGLAAEYAKLELAKKEQAQVLAGIKDTLNSFVELRAELCQKRQMFIDSVIGGNAYVRMSILPFADTSTLEREVRSILGIDGERYTASLYDDENKSGLLAELINWEKNGVAVEQLPEKIDELKKHLWAGAHGESSGGQAPFDKRLRAIYEENPAAFNEISAYWPEDKLEVKYLVNGKTQRLEDGSAGQKSAAILSFLLSYGTEPLVMDQPEDDLDNSLIMELVVKQLHVNKQRRQLIIATHNPNVVVNGDSEQVCVMKFVNGLIGTSGQDGLDDTDVRKSICTIMEGGADAFKKRYDRMMGDCDA